jgi:SHS2 domain-containing protein
VPYRFLEHTADAGIEVTGGSLPELFSEALRGMMDVVTSVEQVAAVRERPVEVAAERLDLLLLELLAEALYRFEVDRELCCRARVEVVEKSGGWSASGALFGEALDAERHPMKVMIKAVTYHRLEVARVADGWRARVIFDI